MKLFTSQQHTNQKGFAILVSVIVLSIVIVLISYGISIESYFSSSGEITSLDKQQTHFLAFTCIDRALFILADDLDYRGGEDYAIDGYICHLGPIVQNNDTFVIRASASLDRSVTNLNVLANEFLIVSSFKEE